jgi:hypothetical protein
LSRSLWPGASWRLLSMMWGSAQLYQAVNYRKRLERSMVSNQTRLDTQEGEIEDLRRQIVTNCSEGRIADHALLTRVDHLRG